MGFSRKIKERATEAREVHRFAKLVAEVDAPFNTESFLRDPNSMTDALDELVNLLASRAGIDQVLRRYEQHGVSKQDRLKNLYWKLMAGSMGPTTSGICVATAAICDPSMLMFLLQKESEGLNDLGRVAWHFAEDRWSKGR